MKPKSAAVLGAGAVGSALKPALRRAGVRVVAAWSRRQGPLPSRVRDAAVVLLAVPDGAVGGLCARLARDRLIGKGQIVAHLAGPLSLEPLRPALAAGARTGSLHPLRAFVRGQPAGFAGAYAGVAGSDAVAARALRGLALALGMRPFRAGDAERPLYHAAAVLSAGAVVALFAQAVRALSAAAGLSEARARAALLPLTRSAIARLESDPAGRAVTGPAARGDAASVRLNRDALSGPAALLYSLLAAESARLARQAGRIDAAAARKVLRALAPRPRRR